MSSKNLFFDPFLLLKKKKTNKQHIKTKIFYLSQNNFITYQINFKKYLDFTIINITLSIELVEFK